MAGKVKETIFRVSIPHLVILDGRHVLTIMENETPKF
jgi:hypothetical protein